MQMAFNAPDDTSQTVLSIIDNEIRKIEGNMKTLRKRRNELLEKKSAIVAHKKRAEVGVDVGYWETNEFEWTTSCMDVLRNVFKFDEFRQFQRSAINAVMSNRDVVLILSTGGGKSLCYQIPSLIMNGVTLVVSPLVSLIEDQLYYLRKLNIVAETITQSTSKDQVKRIEMLLLDPKSSMKIIYVTPEKLAKSKRFMNKLEKAHELKCLKVVHCCSQWGHDFRPDFKFLNILKRLFKSVPILGVTATATSEVIDDVKDMLGIPDAIQFRDNFNRPNLYYEVRYKNPCKDQLLEEIVSFIDGEFRKQTGIIYCSTRKDCEVLAESLRSRNIKAAPYQAYMDSDQKTKIHQLWINNEVQVIVATIAFESEVLILAFDLQRSSSKAYPKNLLHCMLLLEMVDQCESGRAGRDGNHAKCLIYYSLSDLFRVSTMVCPERNGKANLYSMMQYCLCRKDCRRSLLADHFREVFDRSQCRTSCDNCETKEPVNKIDISKYWRVMIDIIREQKNSKTIDSSGRITGHKLIEITMKRLRSVAKVILEVAVGNLLLLGYIVEDFHYTPYNIISYISAGSKTPVHESDQSHTIIIDVPCWLSMSDAHSD